MKFNSAQDAQLFIHFNRELINEIIDVEVLIYKLNTQESKRNVYGESSNKQWYTAVQVPCLINRDLGTAVKDMETVNIEQTSEFYFLRQECIDRNIYPAVGDFIFWNEIYFEIDIINETQLIAGQRIYNFALLVGAHMTRTTTLQLDEPII